MRRRINFDTLNKVLLAIAVILLILPGTYFKVLAGVFLTLFFIRTYSSNRYKIEQQNQVFVNIFRSIKSRFTSSKARDVETFDAESYTKEQTEKQRQKEEKKRQRDMEREQKKQEREAKKEQKQREKEQKADKENVYTNCPNCNQQLRLPKDKGKLNVTCPNCKHKFMFDTSKK